MKHRPQGLVFPAFPPAFLLLLFILPYALPAQSAGQAAAPKAAQSSQPAKGAELREGSLDMVVLLDKSLSMAPFFDQAKAYVAGSLIGPILVPGDRLIIETVYGKVDRLLSATIASEDDKAKVIRAIRAVKANGRFTDLGAALDAAKRDLDELGKPERPKYVVLVSDERQEAPKGSPYQAPDHKLKHPSLQYVKKVDLGKFRAITVGLQVAPKVDQAAPVVMQLLMDLPVRAGAGGAQGAGAAGGAEGGAAGSSAGNAAGSAAESGIPEGGATRSERALPSWILYCALGVLVLALAGLGAALLVSRRRKEDKAERAE